MRDYRLTKFRGDIFLPGAFMDGEISGKVEDALVARTHLEQICERVKIMESALCLALVIRSRLARARGSCSAHVLGRQIFPKVFAFSLVKPGGEQGLPPRKAAGANSALDAFTVHAYFPASWTRLGVPPAFVQTAIPQFPQRLSLCLPSLRVLVINVPIEYLSQKFR
jgi:hypothetical protein